MEKIDMRKKVWLILFVVLFASMLLYAVNSGISLDLDISYLLQALGTLVLGAALWIFYKGRKRTKIKHTRIGIQFIED